VTCEIIRILSDMHYGDRASRVRSLAGLRPLFEGADRIVFNGDSIETRAGADPRLTARLRRRFLEFVRRELPRCVLLTGNHDADISEHHHLDLLGGLVFVTHGEILFDDLVPWSAEQPRISELYRQQLASLTPAEQELLESRLGACKRACAQLQLLHDPLPRGRWSQTVRAARIFWPPRRAVAMVRAWRELPERVAAVVRCYRPAARFAIVGHTHLPGVWFRGGVIVVNTGSFAPPLGGYAVDVSPEQVVVRRIRHHAGRFGLGRIVASFALAPTRDGSEASSAAVAGLAPAP
jgi:predicted phosphodiesterase